jgi:hypothetical protein
MGLVRAIRRWLGTLCVNRGRGVAAAAPPADAPAGLGPVRADRGVMGFALYVPRASRVDAEALVDAVLRKHGGFQRTQDRAPARLPSVFVEHLASALLPRPDRRRLQVVGRGLGAQEQDTIAESRRAVFVRFDYAADEAFERIHRAHAIVSELAAAIGSPVQSDDNGIVYGRAAWADRAAHTGEHGPEVGALVCIHVHPAAGDPPLDRHVSLGMAALGLPDLAIDHVPRAIVEETGWLVETVGQLLAEGAAPDGDGHLDVRLSALRGSRLRQHIGARARADGHLRVRLVAARRQAGDADNRLWAIELHGDDPPAARSAGAVAALFAGVATVTGDAAGS